jgi:hypothetical protein
MDHPRQTIAPATKDKTAPIMAKTAVIFIKVK